MSKQAPIVIDVQNDYFPDGRSELANMDAASANVGRLLRHYRSRDTPVVHIRHQFPDAASAPFFAPGSHGAAIHPSAAPVEGEPVLPKHHINSLRDTALLEILRGHGVDEVVISRPAPRRRPAPAAARHSGGSHSTGGSARRPGHPRFDLDQRACAERQDALDHGAGGAARCALKKAM